MRGGPPQCWGPTRCEGRAPARCEGRAPTRCEGRAPAPIPGVMWRSNPGSGGGASRAARGRAIIVGARLVDAWRPGMVQQVLFLDVWGGGCRGRQHPACCAVGGRDPAAPSIEFVDWMGLAARRIHSAAAWGDTVMRPAAGGSTHHGGGVADLTAALGSGNLTLLTGALGGSSTHKAAPRN